MQLSIFLGRQIKESTRHLIHSNRWKSIIMYSCLLANKSEWMNSKGTQLNLNQRYMAVSWLRATKYLIYQTDMPT